MRYSRPGSSAELSAIQHTVASNSRAARGWFVGRAIMSPREMSRSSASLTDIAIGGNASATGQYDDFVARSHHSAGHAAGVAAVVLVLASLRPDDVLDGEPDVDQVAVA